MCWHIPFYHLRSKLTHHRQLPWNVYPTPYVRGHLVPDLATIYALQMDTRLLYLYLHSNNVCLISQIAPEDSVSAIHLRHPQTTSNVKPPFP